MKLRSLEMSSIYERRLLDYLGENNVTTRRNSGSKKGKMALASTAELDLQQDGSLFVDSILSQDESMDIVTMMIMADEHSDKEKLPSFYTSTQMGGLPPTRPISPPLSPLNSIAQDIQGVSDGDLTFERGARSETVEVMELRSGNPPTCSSIIRRSQSNSSIEETREEKGSVGRTGPGTLPSLGDATLINSDRNEVNIHDTAGPLGGAWTVDLATNLVSRVATEIRDGNRVEEASEHGDGRESGTEEVNSECGDGYGSGKEADAPKTVNADPSLGIILVSADERDEFDRKVKLVDGLIAKLGGQNKEFGEKVTQLEHSLEFSQHEIDVLKRENETLKQRIHLLDMEDKRTQFQVNSVEDKVDRLDTMGKKRNLTFEGVAEFEGRRENVEKTVGDIFEQLQVTKPIGFEACYRMGSANKNHPRAIMITFEHQADRDAIYARRMELKNTAHYKRVWFNEDLGPLSQKKRGIIRLIAREARSQGIDCRSGKYAVHINNTKFDCDNLEELPPHLHPTQLKQVQINDKVIAYQSEFAPFSNFYECAIMVGPHKFFCLEQAFQFVKAKTLCKPLAAIKIYLSRDVRYIKQLGHDLGTSDLWEARQFDVMYECLKRKFTQNPDLGALLIKTGDMLLVEATPDRMWGCGATLSSNVLRRGEWQGHNKHGKILMTVRDELKLKATR